ncbi:MAG: DNA-binding protein [Idiomarina sp.]|nr:DNA-binding protein [Idiomarina sp.]
MVAEALGKSPSIITKVVSRQAKSRLVAEAIARILQRDVKDVFPDVPEYQLAPVASGEERDARVEELKALLKTNSEQN